MKVKDLIKELQKFDPEKDVFSTDWCDVLYEINSIEIMKRIADTRLIVDFSDVNKFDPADIEDVIVVTSYKNANTV